MEYRRLLNRILEILIVMAVCFFIWSAFKQSPREANPGDKWKGGKLVLKSGRTFSPAGASGNRRHMFLFIQTGCPSCNADKPFYRQLASEISKRTDIDLIVLAGESTQTVTAWLETGAISPVEGVIRLKSSAREGLVYTPTLFITSSDGRITDFITGELSPSDKDWVIRRVASNDSPPIERHVFAEEVTAATFGQTGAQFLDIRSRKKFSRRPSLSATHIPVDELSIRSLAELKIDLPVAIDCTWEEWGYCRIAGAELIALGFRDVTVILPD